MIPPLIFSPAVSLVAGAGGDAIYQDGITPRNPISNHITDKPQSSGLLCASVNRAPFLTRPPHGHVSLDKWRTYAPLRRIVGEVFDPVSPLASAPTACAAPRPYGVRDNAPTLRQSLGSFSVAIEANIAAAHN